MSNLKKILALVLALVMSMSLVTVASAAYADQDQVDARYAEAVEVLSDMGIFQGYNGGASFGPKKLITREEVATMMYRVISKDTTGKAGLYVEACDFADVNAGRWSEGYIGYCFNGNYVKGYEDGTFRPTNNVTGYEVLAMILRAVGFDANNEFSGSNWKKNIATRAQQLGILDNLAADVVLSKPATREVVAELIFKTLAYVDMVEYTPAFNYQPIMVNNTIGLTQITLGEDNFNLTKGAYTEYDKWGRPGYSWTYNVGARKTVIEETPVATYTVATTECEIAVDLARTGNQDVAIAYWFNGYKNSDTINPIHQHNITTNLMGAQGSLIEIYEGPTAGADDDRIVHIDTYLAQVVGVTKEVLDKNNHVIVPASNALMVYGFNPATPIAAVPGLVETYNYSIAGNKYTVGQYILISICETDYSVYVDHGVASSKTAAQDVIWWNANNHTIEGVVYPDAAHYHLDAAGIDLSAKYTWFFDQYNNVIGSVKPISIKTYGVVENVQWINTVGTAGYAAATIRYMDGTTAEKTIAKVNGINVFYADLMADYSATNNFSNGQVFTTWQYNDDEHLHLYEIAENSNGTLNLTEVLPHNTGATLLDGQSAVVAADGSVICYVDNYTKFLVRSGSSYTAITGYDALEMNWTDAATIDFVPGANGYAQYVYVYGTVDSAAPSAYTEFLYFTNKAANFGETTIGGTPVFAIGGVVHTDGSTKPLYVAQNAAGTKAETKAELLKLLGEVQDELYLVKTYGGVLTALNETYFKFVPVTGEANTVGYSDWATYSKAGTFTHVDGNGVMKIHTNNFEGILDAINVNTSTTIINEGEVATVTELNNAVLTGKNIYVVTANNYYSGKDHRTTQAICIFISAKANPVDEAAAAAAAAMPAAIAPVTVTDSAVDSFAGAKAAIIEELEAQGATSRGALTGYVIEKVALDDKYVAPALGGSAEYTWTVTLSYRGIFKEFDVTVTINHAYTAAEAYDADVMNVALPATGSYVYEKTADVNTVNAGIVYVLANDAAVKAAMAKIDGDVAIVVTLAQGTKVEDASYTYSVKFVVDAVVVKELTGKTITLTLIKK